MENRKPLKPHRLAAQARLTSRDLRGRQSVRATFRLSEACIEAINILSTQLGIKQKSVFDYLMEDDQALREIARELGGRKLERPSRVQKTYVVSRRSLACLERVSGEFNAPRDALVEYSVRRLLPIILEEGKKHQQRKKLLAELEAHLNQARRLLAGARKVLGADDPVSRRLETVVAAYEAAYEAIEAFVAKGKALEDFRPPQDDAPPSAGDTEAGGRLKGTPAGL